MIDSASLLSAGAASVAAILAGLNLYLSGRRERNRWARDVLIDAFVTFLNASFKITGLCRMAADLRRSSGSPEKLEELYQEIGRAHSEQTNVPTKLRLLTSPVVVDSAMSLHVADHAYVNFVQLANKMPEPDEQKRIAGENWQARRAFLSAAKTEIGLRSNVSSATHVFLV